MGTKKEMAYLCQCNNCNTILIDKNPQSCAVMHELNGTESEMQYVDDKDGGYWVCPVCNTHDYLSDVITRRVSTQSKEVLNITPGEWIYNGGTDIKTPKEFLTADGNIANGFIHIANVSHLMPNREREANAKAICTAVNNTYGKGYRPEAMDELYKALEQCYNLVQVEQMKNVHKKTNGLYYRDDVESAFLSAKTALQNAKL